MVLAFQPKVSITERKLVGVEILLRWRDPKRGLIGPDAVVPVAEESGLINELTAAVIRKAMAQCGALRADGLDFKVAVNVSIDDLNNYDFPDFVVTTAEVGSFVVEGAIAAGSVPRPRPSRRLSRHRRSRRRDPAGPSRLRPRAFAGRAR